MNFKDLREADLSKAQIKKVHDKADDLPKNDFIKRYGKEGDAVRFATATNIVKKQLGIGEGFKSDAQRKAAFASGYKEKGKNKKEELDKEDEKTVGDVVKQLKKAVKAHQSQVDTLTKDIKDEVEVTEARARMPSDNNIKKKHGNATPMKSYKQGFDAANKGKKITTNPHKSMFGFDRGAWDKGFKDADQGFDIKTFSQRDYDRNGKIKKEEVELDEVHFSNRGEPAAPKGMHKLRSGRDIPSSPEVDKIHKKVVAMTDRNDHSGARIEIAKQVGDNQLVQIFSTLQLMHDKYSGAVGNQAIELRNKFEPVLNKAIDRKFGKYADVIQDAL